MVLLCKGLGINKENDAGDINICLDFHSMNYFFRLEHQSNHRWNSVFKCADLILLGYRRCCETAEIRMIKVSNEQFMETDLGKKHNCLNATSVSPWVIYYSMQTASLQ